MDILFVRHASSCSNVTTLSMSRDKKLHTDLPSLSDFGLLQIKQIREKTPNIRPMLRQRQVITCSPMVRAMETASFLYPKRSKIYVLPYMDEVPSRGYVETYNGDDTESVRGSKSKLMNILKSHGHKTSKFDWSIHDMLTGGSFKIPDVGVFIRTVEPYLKSKFKNKKITCVSHGNWMTEYLRRHKKLRIILSEPKYMPESCQARLKSNKIGNCGMFNILPNSSINHVYETNGVSDGDSCILVDKKRHPKSLKKKHVRRCSNVHVRSMPELE